MVNHSYYQCPNGVVPYQFDSSVSSKQTDLHDGTLICFGDMATFQKQPNFPFGAWTIYSPWSSKNLIDWNQLKKFIQVGIDVTCMHTDFGGRGLSSFGDKISLWSIKVEKCNQSESAQKNLCK